MNNIVILSKIGFLTSISGQLNILSRLSTGSNIRNLYVNMLISSLSNGNISLIGSSSGSINIRNYQVSGTYYSQQQLSLCAINSNFAQFSIFNVNFNPSIYIFGNSSSYLFAYVSSSSIQIQQLVLSVGLSTVNSLQTTQSSTIQYQFQFGGIISQISASSVIIHNSAVKAYLNYTSNYMNSSGIITGTSSTTIISINNICLLEYTTFIGSFVNQSGLLGTIGGKVSVSNANIQYSVYGNGSFSNFGTLGVLSIECSNGSFSNLQISFASIQKSSYDANEINIAVLIGKCNAKYVQLNQSTFQGNVSAASNIAILSGLQNSNFIIYNIDISNSKIISSSSSSSISGGVFGKIEGVSNINKLNYLQINVNILSQSLNINSYSSGIIGESINVDNIIIEKLYIYNSSIQSKSQNGQSLASGIIASSTKHNINIKYIEMNNISVISMSQNSIGISAGYVALITSSNIQCSDLNISDSLIQSDSCAPMVSGIIGTFNYSNLIMQNTFVSSSKIFGSDARYNNLSNDIIRQSSGVLSFVNHSDIRILKTNIQDVNISIISNLNKASTSGIIGWLLYSNSTQKSIQILNVYQNSYSLNNNSHSGGFNSIVDQSIDYQYSNQIANSTIITVCQVYNPLQYSYSFTGSMNGYIAGSNVQFINFKALFINITTNGSRASYGGGLVGKITDSGVAIKESSLIIYGGEIYNLNIASKAIVNGVAGSVIGFATGNSNITIDSIIINNAINNVTAQSVFAGSFAGSQASQQSYAFVKITNSEIYSVKIYYQNQTLVLINFILRPQLAELTNGLIQISSTKSLGFSSINGIPVSNCENVQVQYINGNNYISENGCI
ncbi:Hypothetical_protein [Hexamita inflata]|uniref:Hypothetical_protein n=1 Tax=Hexamita inflata TaxID=28002 RepID=A0AA86ULQ0_9EUKA|nr:Hypothetical protein HINF_LOCUS43862 [Hexamita inflata]